VSGEFDGQIAHAARVRGAIDEFVRPQDQRVVSRVLQPVESVRASMPLPSVGYFLPLRAVNATD
jgi:hypothetical protein